MIQPSNFILQKASAGSGKTFALVKRYLTIILNSDNPELFKQILAITFTNKASLEMKERIVNNLISFAKENAENDFLFLMICEELAIEPTILKQRAKNVLTKIIHQYSQFSVSTIDKFNLRLMRSFSFELGLSTNFTVELEKTGLLIEAINLLFEDIGKNELLTENLIEYSFENIDNDVKWDLNNSILKSSENIFSEQFSQYNEQLKEIEFQKYAIFKKELTKTLTELKKKLKESVVEAQNLIEEYSLETKDFYRGDSGGIGSYFIKILDENYARFNSYHIKFLNAEQLYSKTTKQNIKDAIDAIQPKLSEIAINCNNLVKEFNYKTSVKKSLNNQSLYNEVIKKLFEIKEDKNVLLINEFNKIISEHIRNQAAAFIYEKIGEYFKHFFIDEFQDTSTLQWQNLTPLIENAIASDGSVFIVGDVKQSIYQFRGANPKLMIDLIENAENHRLKVETLTTNYRSFSKVIEFNNHFYNFIAANIANEKYKFVYNDVNQLVNNKTGGYVQLNYFNEFDENQVYEKIYESIQKSLEANYNYSDIAILVSDKIISAKIAEFLSKKDIPIISSKSLFLNTSEEINCLVSCLKIFINVNDQESITKFCISLNKIKKIPSDIDFTLFIQKLISFKNIDEFIAFVNQQINIDLNNSFQEENDLYSKIEKLIFNLNFKEATNTYIQTFLAIVFNFSTQKESSLLKFIEFFERENKNIEISIPKDLDAVKILTVHASKGLEFPVVIIPNFNFSIKQDSMWIPTENHEIPVVYTKKTLLEQIENTEIETKIEEEKDFHQLELFNKIYVATTRAVDKLFIISEKNSRKSSNSKDYFKLYIDNYFNDETEIKFGEFEENITLNQNSPKVALIKSTFFDWSSKIAIAQKYIKLYENENRNYGNLIHLFLGEIYSKQDIERIIDKNINDGIIESNKRAEIVNLLVAIVNHSELKDFFEKKDKTIYNERTFISKNGEFLRPDKVVIDQNNITIIDYKTGNKEESHKNQLNNYQELFLNENKKIIKKLIYIKNNKIEIIAV